MRATSGAAMAMTMVMATGLLVARSVGAAGAAGAAGVGVGEGGVLLKDGRPIRAVGVNYYSAFERVLRDGRDRSYEAGFAELGRLGIPFARVSFSGYWPSELRLYLDDRAEYLRRLDGVVAAAEKHGVGLVPSLFWHHATVPDLVGEPCSAWGDAESRTVAFMRRYTADVVARYKGSPAVWGWEFGNEFNLAADLPNAASHRPPTRPRLGTPATRSTADDLTSEMVRTAVAAFAREVRRHDAGRFITTGHAIPRPAAWHLWKRRAWTRDAPEQAAEAMLHVSPSPAEVISIHAYGQDLGRIAAIARLAAAAGRPVFVGEFQVDGIDDEATRRRFAEVLETIRATEAIALAAVWVYDFPAQESECNVTATNRRAWQLAAIGEVNRRLAAKGR